MKLGRYTTVVITADGAHHDLGQRQRPPRHAHEGRQGTTCAACRIVDARTMHVEDVRLQAKKEPAREEDLTGSGPGGRTLDQSSGLSR